MGTLLSRVAERHVVLPKHSRSTTTVGTRNLNYAWIEPISMESTVVRSGPPPDDSGLLKVIKVDLNIEVNTQRHKTSDYDVTEAVDKQQLVIRRGKAFDIDVTFNKEFSKETDDIRLVFEFGQRPLPNKATHIEVLLSDDDLYKQWGARILSINENTLVIRVYTPPTLFVGKWSFQLDVVKQDDADSIVYRYTHDQSIYILFNPWCRDDPTYLHDEKLLEEYVLADTGTIYQGTAGKPSPRPWNYNQFDPVALDCALMVLDKSNLPLGSRGDPIQIVRRLSAMTNAKDDDGILVGDWSGNYGNGTLPSKWVGSLDILEQYYSTKKPVYYGQCWVFAGVLTTLCRTLGIPTRCVTNFSSAHDADGSLTVDKFWTYANPGYKPLEEYNSDSVWNFHVWNEVWMTRPDLPSGYGGWQAIDATPQETSDGIFCCGPMSVVALQEGNVNLPYDGPFIFSEVNADKVHWVRQPNGKFQKAALDKRSIGRKISTILPKCKKTDGTCDEREDITDQYKFKEGTMAERTSVIMANSLGSSRAGMYKITNINDVSFELSPLDRINYGSDFDIEVKIKNESSEIRTVDGFVCTNTIYYTGVAFKNVKEHTYQGIEIKPGESKELKLQVTVDDYIHKLIDYCNFHVSCASRVKETNQIFTSQDSFCLAKPELKIEAPDTGKVGETFSVEISFTNPLPLTLTHCELRIEGPGLQRLLASKERNVEAKGEFKKTVTLTPAKMGTRKILANFNSKEIFGVVGYREILVEQK